MNSLEAALLPPAYGVWREGNVFSLSVHRGPPGGTPQLGVPLGVSLLGGHPEGTPQLGGHPLVPPNWGAPPGYPPINLDKNVGQILGQKMDKVLDKTGHNFGQKNWTNILETFGGERGGATGGTPLAVTQEDCLVRKCPYYRAKPELDITLIIMYI